MIDALKFVKGAVAKKDFVPALTHFKISGGRIMGYNGRISLSSPIDLDVEVYPRAIPFVKAIQSCKESVAINLTKAGRLSIKSGKFRAYIECLTENYPEFEPEGELLDLPDNFIPALKKLTPIIGDDASRPWATGVLLRGHSAFATNNVILAEYWLGTLFPYELNIPGKTIQELIRLGEPPTQVQVAKDSMTFHFPGERWLRTQLKDANWPNLEKVLNAESTQKEIPDGFYEAVETAKHFSDDLERIYFHSGGLGTTPVGQEEGAHVEVPGLHGAGIYNAKHLMVLRELATTIDFESYPRPSLFFGVRVRGAIIGMRPENAI